MASPRCGIRYAVAVLERTPDGRYRFRGYFQRLTAHNESFWATAQIARASLYRDERHARSVIIYRARHMERFRGMWLVPYPVVADLEGDD